jgi:hypothetical protein
MKASVAHPFPLRNARLHERYCLIRATLTLNAEGACEFQLERRRRLLNFSLNAEGACEFQLERRRRLRIST